MTNADCPFCNAPDFERLIVQDDCWYSIATLGQIAPGYVPAIPKEHLPCIGAVSVIDLPHLMELQAELFEAISAEYTETNPKIETPAIMFEHGMVGQTVKHAHFTYSARVCGSSSACSCRFSRLQI
jgi:diadenosine tetraphosphate (Ap4A) HIT family hydrolase